MECRNIITEPIEPNISKIIPPNFGTWQTIEIGHQCAKYVIDNNILGDFVECGVAGGNNFGAMLLAGRGGYGYDSFIGIPWAGKKDDCQPGIGVKDLSKEGLLETSGVSSCSAEQVEMNLLSWGLSNFTLVEGWFQDTVKYHKGKISVLRLDGDLYESTIVCLEALYPKLSKGGILIIDDWNLLGCRRAFFEYFHKHKLPEFLHDNGRCYWLK